MKGFNKDFLGKAAKSVVLPSFGPELDGFVLKDSDVRADGEHTPLLAHYQNYTVAMHRVLKAPLFAALNIKQNKLKTVSSSVSWRIDTRIGRDFQLNNDYYRDRPNTLQGESGEITTSDKNPYDRGHMARRAAAAWGETTRIAKLGSDDTYFYANACLQHGNFNQDEWVSLEDWVIKLELDLTGCISVFTGPIFGQFSRSVTPQGRDTALIPAAFFKVVVFINKNDKLDARAFIMAQDAEAIRDRRGRRMLDFQRYQVSVTEIEEKTGLRFDDKIPNVNPLRFNISSKESASRNISHFPERIEVDHAAEMINTAKDRRVFIRDDQVPVYIAGAMVNPSGSERDGEWVSVINLSSQKVSIEGWKLSDTRRGPLVLQGALETGEARRIQPIRPLSLANQGGVIDLHDKEDHRIDRVKYTEDDAGTADRVVTFAHRHEHV